MVDMTEHTRVIAWFSGRDTGMSSKAIATAMSGMEVRERYTPADPDDLGRCLRLMARFPEWAPERFVTTMSAVSEDWACFAEDWPKLARSMADEVGIDWSKGRSAPKTYALMKATEDRARRTPAQEDEILAQADAIRTRRGVTSPASPR